MTCLACNGAGYVTAPAQHPRPRHQQPFVWTSRAGTHQTIVHHGREARRCDACEGDPS